MKVHLSFPIRLTVWSFINSPWGHLQLLCTVGPCLQNSVHITPLSEAFDYETRLINTNGELQAVSKTPGCHL